MATIETRSGHVVLVDDADFWLINRVSIGSHGYAQISVAGRVELLHRWLMGCTPGDGRIVDHANRNRLDNRRQNLRIVTASENTQNRVSGPMRGVDRTRQGRYSARAKLAGRVHRLGTFDTPEEAHAAAVQFRRQHFSQIAS
jgi:hypothetical protein